MKIFLGPPLDFTCLTRYPNGIKKLIELPGTSISLVAAVGVRNGLNIIQPLAAHGWPVKSNFDNILEMLQNIAGTSKSSFFGHDRYYKFKKVASKPNRVGRALQSIKKLNDEDREILRLETMKVVQEMEVIREKLQFAHLPVIPVK